jgi:hypothetical protein
MRYLDRFGFAASYLAYASRWRDNFWRIPDDRRAIVAEGFKLAYEVRLADVRCRFVARPKVAA